MSNKKNYGKMYSAEEPLEPVVSEAVVPTEVEAVPEEVPVEKPIAKKKPKTLKGEVINCAKLNVREQASIASAVLCVLPVGSEVKVFANAADSEWEHVITNDGVEGFCMKKYIAIYK